MQTTNNMRLGMNQDIDPKYQPEGTYRYALNSVLETREGDLSNIACELGNTSCGAIPEGMKIIGHTLTDTDDIVVFLYDPTDPRPEHQIGIFNPTSCTYTLIAKAAELNFKDPINALFRVRNGCDRIIYFTDNTNPYRVANITDTSYWVNPSTKAIIDINRISFSPDFETPAINTSNTLVLDGKGSLPYGVRSYYIQLLDQDRNPIHRWIPLTNYIPVTYDSNSGADNTDASPFYRFVSNKAIQLDIDYIDISFNYYRLGIVKREGIDETITGVDITFPIQSSENVYIDRGDNIDFSTDIDFLLIDNLKVDKVKAHVLDRDRLYLGNHSTEYRDYSFYQRYASKIRVTYTTSVNNNRNPTDDQAYIVPTSFLKDDVVALGIVYHFSDGTDSPVYHIPGRAADIIPVDHTNPYITSFTDWDTDEITDDNEVSGNKRWQVYNTASLSADSTTANTGGYLGYYEISNTYTPKTSCDGEDYWGLDYWDNELSNTPIRHHRIPSNLIFIDDDPYKSANLHHDIFLKLDNIEFPTGVSGYSIVVGEGESTIVDRGYLNIMHRDVTRKEASSTDDTYFHSYIEMDSIAFDNSGTPPVDTGYWDVGPTPYYSFISPKGVYQSSKLNGNYISIEKILLEPTNRVDVATTLDELTYNAQIECNSFINDYQIYGRPESRINYLVEDTYYLAKSVAGNGSNLPDDLTEETIATSQTTPAPGETLQNRSKNHNINVLKLEEALVELSSPSSPGGPYPSLFNGVSIVANLKTTKEVYTNLNTITYKRLTSKPYFDENTVVLEAGNAFGVFFDTVENYWGDDVTDDGVTDIVSYQSFVTSKFDYPLNIELRSKNNEQQYKYFEFTGSDHLNFRRYIVSKYYELEVENPLFFPESYILDEKYSKLLSDKPYFPPSFDYDYCNICIENTPFRIYYSQEDNTENQVDLLRQIKINNYRDIPANTGVITDMFSSFDEIYVGTPQTLYKAHTRPQTIQASGNTTYLGTGEVLSLPFQSLKSPDFALGGIQYFKDRVQTEFGLFYVDSLSGRPFLLTNTINDISLQSMRNFWEENGTMKLKSQIKELANYDYTFYNTPHYIGYAVAYDPRFKRLIIHKKDYEISPKYSSTFRVSTDTSIVTPLTLWFDGTTFYYNNAAGTPSAVTLDNDTYFESRSFTISYSFVTSSWVSFHSYFPYYLMNDYNTFYSNGIYKHNTGNYQTYYGIKYPHIVDIIAKHDPLNAKVFSSIYFSSKSQVYDTFSKNFRNHGSTFNGVVAYNNSQCSGYKELELSEPFSVSDSTKAYITKIDNLYRLNDLRDIVIDKNNPIWTSEWSAIKSTPYIDKIVNTSNINVLTSEYEQARFRDYYLGLRFFFTNPANIKITTDLITTNYENRNR